MGENMSLKKTSVFLSFCLKKHKQSREHDVCACGSARYVL